MGTGLEKDFSVPVLFSRLNTKWRLGAKKKNENTKFVPRVPWSVNNVPFGAWEQRPGTGTYSEQSLTEPI